MIESIQDAEELLVPPPEEEEHGRAIDREEASHGERAKQQINPVIEHVRTMRWPCIEGILRQKQEEEEQRRRQEAESNASVQGETDRREEQKAARPVSPYRRVRQLRKGGVMR